MAVLLRAVISYPERTRINILIREFFFSKPIICLYRRYTIEEIPLLRDSWEEICKVNSLLFLSESTNELLKLFSFYYRCDYLRLASD